MTAAVNWTEVHEARDTTTALQELERVTTRAERLALAASVRTDALLAARMSVKPPSGEPEPQEAPPPPKYVLLIEDNGPLRARTKQAIEAAGLLCEAVGAGCEGCDLVREAARGACPLFDVVVADLDLGSGCRGSAVLLEAEKWIPRARRIVWSGKLTPEELAQAVLGCHAHTGIPKGTSASVLVAAIRGLVGVRPA